MAVKLWTNTFRKSVYTETENGTRSVGWEMNNMNTLIFANFISQAAAEVNVKFQHCKRKYSHNDKKLNTV
jgi:hypothetical protein